MKKTIKAWAVVRGGVPLIESTHQYTFEVDAKIPRQSFMLVAETKTEATAYKKKWTAGARDMKIIPCTITYELP